MNTTPQIDAIAAFDQVKQAVAALRHEYRQAGEAVAKLEADMATLPQMRAPFDDMKRGIVELIDTAGQRYTDDHIKPALMRFATNGMGSISRSNEESGKPLTLAALDGAVSGSRFPEARAQLVHPDKSQFDDLVFYALCADAVKAALVRVLDNITPEEFGYNTVHPDKIGPTRAEMFRQLDQWQQQLDALKARRADIRSQLAQLGVNVA